MVDDDDVIDQQLLYEWNVDSPATYTSGASIPSPIELVVAESFQSPSIFLQGQSASELRGTQRYDSCDLSDVTQSFLSTEVDIEDQEVFIEESRPLFHTSYPLDSVALFSDATQTMPSPLLSLRHSSSTVADSGAERRFGSKSTKNIENGFAGISLTNQNNSLPQFNKSSRLSSNQSSVSSHSFMATSSPQNSFQMEFPVVDDRSTFYSPLPVAMVTSPSAFGRNCCFARSPHLFGSTAVVDSPLTPEMAARNPRSVFDFDVKTACDQYQFPNNAEDPTNTLGSRIGTEATAASFRSSQNGYLLSKMTSPSKRTLSPSCKNSPSSIGRRRMGVSSDDFSPSATNVTVSEVRIKPEIDFASASPSDCNSAYAWSASSRSYGDKDTTDSIGSGKSSDGRPSGSGICDHPSFYDGAVFSGRRSGFSSKPTSATNSRMKTSLGRHNLTESTAEKMINSQTVLGSCVSLATTSDDILRRKKRREQNRRAARKCREKKKENVDSMRKAFDRTQEENARLRVEKDKLEMMVVRLQDMMRFHRSVCKLQPHQQQQSAPHQSAQTIPLIESSTYQITPVADFGTMSHCCQPS